MTRDEFISKAIPEKPNINGWDIEPDFLTQAAFVLGCYYNQLEKKWHIYETGERGEEENVFTADSQEEAYDGLYDLIMIHKRLHI